MPDAGYYRDPTINGDTVVFVCEDDLWTVPARGGVARRLTANPGPVSSPMLSPDGAWIAYMGRDEGTDEVYVMPAVGGPARRLSYFGGQSWVVGWTPDGTSIVVASNAKSPFARQMRLFTLPLEGGDAQLLPTGVASSISFGPQGGRVIGRNTTDLARWKRYRGGLTGELWIDKEGNGEWRKLIHLAGNVALPLWIGTRIYFVSDHEGIGNLYSCTPEGTELRRHTHHTTYYVRHPSTDGKRIVYHAGADLFLFDPATQRSEQIEVEFYSPQVQRKRKFIQTDRYLEGFSLHPKGHSFVATIRGKVFTAGNWEGAPVQHGDLERVRYRLATWLHDGKRIATVADAGGEDTLEIHTVDGSQPPLLLESLDIGRPTSLLPSPKQPLLALTNHRNELLLVDPATQSVRVLDRSRYARIQDVTWSPDGAWLAYSFQETAQAAIIKLCRVETGETWPVTKPLLEDCSPSFDPGGKYLYFLSFRDFNPVRDNLHFNMSFPRGGRPFLVTLQADTPSPFGPPSEPRDEEPKAEEPKPEEPKAEESQPKESDAEAGEAAKPEEPKAAKPDNGEALRIDLEGITERLVAFPVPEGRYQRVRAIRGKLLFSVFPIEGLLESPSSGDSGPKGRLDCYDLAERRLETLVNGISIFSVSQDASTMFYRTGNRLRVLKAGEKPKEDGAPSRRTGWIDLRRLRVSITPHAEWEQMYREAWRLQRDHFWTNDMSGVDWVAIYERYLPLLKRVATRAEFSDLLWEMQGELGTSHAYESGGDYRPEPRYDQGFLGADLYYDPELDCYRFGPIVRGDVWDETASSPLARPGINVQPGDRLLAVSGRKVGRSLSPQQLLVHQAAADVQLTVAPAAGGSPRTITIKTLRSERAARYRDWVESNREQVHRATDGRVGYIHIPDMGARGFAEFHRGFLAEVVRDGMIVDVRFNGGGNVSQLLLEKLARRRLAYVVSRWSEPAPYPSYSLLGPMVALTNEVAGSDGDIFSHVFKMMGLGPLIGKRTWGGVIGINPRARLADGSIATQPEFSFWFKDVGWRVENYGTDPDIEVDITPQDYVAGRDPQLERAIEEVLRRMTEQPPERPDFGERPRLALPELPPWDDFDTED
jgi:tricorn protease